MGSAPLPLHPGPSTPQAPPLLDHACTRGETPVQPCANKTRRWDQRPLCEAGEAGRARVLMCGRKEITTIHPVETLGVVGGLGS